MGCVIEGSVGLLYPLTRFYSSAGRFLLSYKKVHLRAIGDEPPSTAGEMEEARATRLAEREAAAPSPTTAAPSVLPSSVSAKAKPSQDDTPAHAKPAPAGVKAKAQTPVMVHRGCDIPHSSPPWRVRLFRITSLIRIPILSDPNCSMNWIFITISIVLPLKNADSSTAQAATLVRNNLARQLNLRNATSDHLLEAVIPAYAIAWNKAVINHLATNRSNGMLTLLRRSEVFRKKEYGRLSPFMLGAYSAAGSVPPDMLERRTVAERFRLETSFGWDTILAVCTQLAASGISLPFGLSLVTPHGGSSDGTGIPHPCGLPRSVVRCSHGFQCVQRG